MTTRLCPICRKPRSAEHTPFCSTRCRDRDLVKWLDDGYAIPGPPAEVPTERDGEEET
jgi:endogenous inhibitor of DNA gyrase (YacG/DUF329 family)